MTTAVGTPLLMAPELVRAGAAGNRDEAQANAAAIDVFSFGVLLWMLWTQQLNPYPDVDDPWRLLGMIVDGRRPPMPPPPPRARDRPSEPANASSRPISTDDADDNDCADTRTTSAQEVATSSNNDAVEADSSDHVVQQQSTSGERHMDNTTRSQMNAELGFERTWNGLPFEYAYETHAVMVKLMEQCWHAEATKRPTMRQVAETLAAADRSAREHHHTYLQYLQQKREEEEGNEDNDDDDDDDDDDDEEEEKEEEEENTDDANEELRAAKGGANENDDVAAAGAMRH